MATRHLLAGDLTPRKFQRIQPNVRRDSPEGASSGRIRELDGWRAASVILVMAHHILGSQHPHLTSGSAALTHLVLYFGQLGVKIFIVISGFVISRLLIAEEARQGSVSLRGFYFRRIFRILPPFHIYLGTLSLLIAFGLIRESWRAILESGLFLFNLSVTPHSWFVGRTWTLAVEEQFYLLFPTVWTVIWRSWRPGAAMIAFVLTAAWNLSNVLTNWDPLTLGTTRTRFARICCGVLMAMKEKRAPACKDHSGADRCLRCDHGPNQVGPSRRLAGSNP